MRTPQRARNAHSSAACIRARRLVHDSHHGLQRRAYSECFCDAELAYGLWRLSVCGESAMRTDVACVCLDTGRTDIMWDTLLQLSSCKSGHGCRETVRERV